MRRRRPGVLRAQGLLPGLWSSLLLLAACGGGAGGGGEQLGESPLWLTAQAARVMPAMGMAAVYVTIENRGSRPDRLLSVSIPAGEASLHETLLENGVSKMRERPEGFEIPAGGTLRLAPGGRHIMVTGMDGANAGLAPGDDAGASGGGAVEIVLRFERAGEHTVRIPAPGGR